MSFKIFWLDIRQHKIMSEKMTEKKVSFGWAVKEYVLPRKKIVATGLILIIIKSVAGLALPFVTRALLDDVFPNEDFPLLMSLVIILAGSILIQALTSFSLTRILSVEAQRLISILRADVQKKLMKLPINFFDNQKSGALVSRVMTDVEGVR
ncbi:MAG: ABC-type bacteriocin/lantibiotic exporter with double-glycine peptidase domain, partial [Arenicella sp.]